MFRKFPHRCLRRRHTHQKHYPCFVAYCLFAFVSFSALAEGNKLELHSGASERNKAATCGQEPYQSRTDTAKLAGGGEYPQHPVEALHHAERLTMHCKNGIPSHLTEGTCDIDLAWGEVMSGAWLSPSPRLVLGPHFGCDFACSSSYCSCAFSESCSPAF